MYIGVLINLFDGIISYKWNLLLKYINEIWFAFNKTALFIAIQKQNIDIVRILCLNKKINIKVPQIWLNVFFYIV